MNTPSSNRGLWITIALLSAGLAVTVTLLITRPAADPAPTAPPTSPPGPSTTHTTTEPTQYKGPGTPSPFGNDPLEADARQRLLVISSALDLHFRKSYDFPDRLEALIAQGLLAPKDLDDPWRRPVDYTRLAKERFKLCSRGKDATSYTDDDICIGPGGREERPGR